MNKETARVSVDVQLIKPSDNRVKFNYVLLGINVHCVAFCADMSSLPV